MVSQQVVQFHECFACIDDPRMKGKCQHPLHSLLFLITAAVIAGADGPSEIEEFGHEKEEWLSEFVDFPEGIPSHDTIGRLLGLINPDDFQVAFLEWIGQIQMVPEKDGPINIQIDGKTSRGSYTNREKSNAIHVVSAWASEAGVTLGQRSVDSKSNEITAIPQVLEMIDLSDTIVSLDALGCQKSIAKKIVDEGGDYILALKDNHPKFCKAVESFFQEAHEGDLSQTKVRSLKTVEKKRGRVDERYYAVVPIPKSMKSMASQWAGLKSIGQAITISESPSGTVVEVRYYLSSRSARVTEFAKSIRSHWSIESMHWILDVVFHEDSSRLRTGYAAENLSFLRKFITTLLKRDTSRGSLKGKRKRAGWNTRFLEKLLFTA